MLSIALVFLPSPQPAPDFFTPENKAREEADQSAAVAQDGAAASPPGVANTATAADLLQIANRQIISTGYLALTVESVPAAVQQVQAVATSFGGFMEHLSQGESGPNAIFAEMTIRVPQRSVRYRDDPPARIWAASPPRA